MSEPLTKEILEEVLEEKIDIVLQTVKQGFDDVDQRFDAVDKRFESVDERFDAVDKRFDAVEKEIVYLKEDIKFLKNEVRALGASMVTKQYLDEKIDQLLEVQQRDSLFKRTLLMALEQAKVLPPETRAKLEALIS